MFKPSQLGPSLVRLSAVLALMPALVYAQDSARVSLPTVQVTGTREGPRAPLDLPYAVTLIRPDSLASLRRAGVDELLFGVPGVALANRQNPAQDPRVSIRGFGARSAFGVRGVRVLQDGVPVTLPDGQTPVDVLDMEGTDRVEVVRGSASSLYGNAAGGVVDLRSARAPLLFTPYARVVGAGSTPTVVASGLGGTIGRAGFTSTISHIAGHGYRDYSEQLATRGAARMVFTPENSEGPASLVIAARVLDQSRADSPGALTRAQFDANPRQADAQSVLKGAGKTVQQADLSVTLAHGLGADGRLDASVFGGARSLKNPLTQSVVDLKRSSGGASLRASGHRLLGTREARVSAGIDAQWMNDNRNEWVNCNGAACGADGTVRGSANKDQRELVGSTGPFVRGELSLLPRLLASVGVRRDALTFRVRDRLVAGTNPDDSGVRSMTAVSPAAGLVWRASQFTSVYGNLSSSFDTPTTTELAFKPDGSPGINPDLQPQRTRNLEVGTKGLLVGSGLRWDVALFQADVRDELVPFAIPSGNGTRYFRNAGRTLRRGAELGLDAETGPVSLHTSYTFSHYRYVNYVVGTTSYAGRRIPGIAEQTLMTSATTHLFDTQVSATADLAGPSDVDDANTAQAPGRAVFGLAVARSWTFGGTRVSPLVAVQNVGGVQYVSSLAVNATLGKFYEPGPGRVLLVRVAVAPAGR